MKNTFISLDKAFEYVGDNSSFQKRTIKILAFQWIFYSFLTMGMPFLFTTPKFICTKIVDGETVSTPCTEEDACQQFRNESTLHSNDNSLSQEFNLYCEKKVVLGFLGSLFFFGNCLSFLEVFCTIFMYFCLFFIYLLVFLLCNACFFSNYANFIGIFQGSTFAGVIFPQLADNFGRKKTMVFAVVLGSISVIICGLVSSIYLFMICIFIAGLCLNGFETIVLVYITEISGNLNIYK